MQPVKKRRLTAFLALAHGSPNSRRKAGTGGPLHTRTGPPGGALPQVPVRPPPEPSPLSRDPHHVLSPGQASCSLLNSEQKQREQSRPGAPKPPVRAAPVQTALPHRGGPVPGARAMPCLQPTAIPQTSLRLGVPSLADPSRFRKTPFLLWTTQGCHGQASELYIQAGRF